MCNSKRRVAGSPGSPIMVIPSEVSSSFITIDMLGVVIQSFSESSNSPLTSPSEIPKLLGRTQDAW